MKRFIISIAWNISDRVTVLVKSIKAVVCYSLVVPKPIPPINNPEGHSLWTAPSLWNFWVVVPGDCHSTDFLQHQLQKFCWEKRKWLNVALSLHVRSYVKICKSLSHPGVHEKSIMKFHPDRQINESIKMC